MGDIDISTLNREWVYSFECRDGTTCQVKFNTVTKTNQFFVTKVIENFADVIDGVFKVREK